MISQGALSSSRIVITGAQGYVGSALALRFADKVHALRLVSRTHDGGPNAGGLPGHIEHVATHLQEEENWLSIIADADAVVHLSARTNLRAAEANPTEDKLLNVEPVRALVRAVSRIRPSRLTVVFASTVTIVGDRHENPVNERTPDNPVSVYDRHKLECEQILADATERGLMQACSLRLSNVYGGDLASQNTNRGILNSMIRNALRGEPITIFGDGHYVRDFIHLDDVIDAFYCALSCERTRNGRHYVVATGKGTTLTDIFSLVAREVSRVTRRLVELRYVSEPKNLHVIERRNFVGNSKLFQTEAGWKPRIDLESGIRRTIKQVFVAPETRPMH